MSNCAFQGSQVLKMDTSVIVRDAYQAIVHRLPLFDAGAIADNGEFYTKVMLSGTTPSFLLDEDLTCYSGDTPLADIDLLYVETTDPILVRIAEGIPLNSVTPGSRNPRGGIFDVSSFLLLRTNSPANIELEEDFDQRILPMKIYLAQGTSSAEVTIYMAKFSA